MQIHQSSIKAAQKGVFHGYELLERTGSGSVTGLWLTALQSLRILESHLCNKGKSEAKFWPGCLLSCVEENEPPLPRKWSERDWHLLRSPSLFWSRRKPSAETKCSHGPTKNWNMALLRGAGARSSCSIQHGLLGTRAKNHNKVVNDSQSNSETLQL